MNQALTKRIARQARSEKRKKLFQIFSRQGGTIELLSEQQEPLATLIESKILDEQKTKEALDLQGPQARVGKF